MVKKGVINLNYYQSKVKQIYDGLDYDLKGGTGVCFPNGKEIIKVYFSPIIEEKMYDMSKYTSLCISFPKYYIVKNKKYYAEVMDYCPSEMVFYAFERHNNRIDLLTENYQRIVQEIGRFPNIYMKDLGFFGNVLYDEQRGFYLIDTTDWVDEDWSNAVDVNKRMLNKALFQAMKLYLYEDVNDLVFRDDLSMCYRGIKETNSGKELLEILQSSLMGKYDFLSFLKAYQETIQNYFGETIETTQDTKKYVKMLKNS